MSKPNSPWHPGIWLEVIYFRTLSLCWPPRTTPTPRTSSPAPAPHILIPNVQRVSSHQGYDRMTKENALFTHGGQASHHQLEGALRGVWPEEEGQVPLLDNHPTPRTSLKLWGFRSEVLPQEAEQTQISEQWLVSFFWMELPISCWAIQALQTSMFSPV